MNQSLFFKYLLSATSYPFTVKIILFEFLVVSIIFSFLAVGSNRKSELYKVLLAVCQLHIKLFTLLGLMGTVTGMIELFYTASINLDDRWMAIGLANTIKPSLMGMLASIITCFLYYYLTSGGSREVEA